MGLFDFFKKKPEPQQQEEIQALEQGLEKTSTGLFSKIGRAVVGKSKVDEEVLDELEEILLTSDVGVATTLKIIERIERRVERDKYVSTEELDKVLREEVAALLEENQSSSLENAFAEPSQKPYVIMVVGVNGVGKTTTIGKLASQFHQNGLKVVLGAADTFRAAAVDQLKLWGERVGIPVIDHGMNTDPAAVAYDAVKQAVEMNADIVIKATKVDGIYTDDPKTNPDAMRYSTVSFDEAINKNLKVMDATALTLCRDQKLPISVFSIFKQGALKRVVMGEEEGTKVLP